MSSFCKCKSSSHFIRKNISICKSYSHFFSKNTSIYAIFNNQSFNDMLTNDIVSFVQLGPALLQTGISVKHQQQNGKQCRSWWDGSLWAVSSGSTLFAKASVLVCRVVRVKMTDSLTVTHMQLYLPPSTPHTNLLITKHRIQQHLWGKQGFRVSQELLTYPVLTAHLT